jgi:hypothetical protein
MGHAIRTTYKYRAMRENLLILSRTGTESNGSVDDENLAIAEVMRASVGTEMIEWQRSLNDYATGEVSE